MLSKAPVLSRHNGTYIGGARTCSVQLLPNCAFINSCIWSNGRLGIVPWFAVIIYTLTFISKAATVSSNVKYFEL